MAGLLYCADKTKYGTELNISMMVNQCVCDELGNVQTLLLLLIPSFNRFSYFNVTHSTFQLFVVAVSAAAAATSKCTTLVLLDVFFRITSS